MSRAVTCWLLSIGLFVPLPHIGGSKAKDTADLGLCITMRVFNYAEVPLETWTAAQTVAERIFGRAGIATVWVLCSLSPDGPHLPPGCEMPVQPTEITLRLVPTSMASRARFGDSTLGIAAHAEPGTPASACVFYGRVQVLAKGGTAPVPVILGQVAAHEIGHLLLGSNSDASWGLMCGKWSRSILRLARDEQLDFLSGEIVSIQKEVRRLCAGLQGAAY